MGYESNFEVPDIDDTLLRGVDDLTDLLCPDSHPEDYASRGYQQGTCVFFWLLLFVLSLRGFFFPIPRREEERSSRVREASRYLFLPKRDREGQKSFCGLSFCPSSRVCAWGAKSARAVKKDALEKGPEGEIFFFLFSWVLERKHRRTKD